MEQNANETKSQAPAPAKRSKGFVIVLVLLVVVGGWFGITTYIHGLHHEETMRWQCLEICFLHSRRRNKFREGHSYALRKSAGSAGLIFSRSTRSPAQNEFREGHLYILRQILYPICSEKIFSSVPPW